MILIVEDDPKLAAMVQRYLEGEGYACSIEPRGDVAVGRILEEHPRAVLLDLRLPGMDGMEVCRAVRGAYTGPILMVTARGDDIDEVMGLELGADDYLPKPVRPRVLLARLRAALRRHEGAPSKRSSWAACAWTPAAARSGWKAASWASAPRSSSCCTCWPATWAVRWTARPSTASWARPPTTASTAAWTCGSAACARRWATTPVHPGGSKSIRGVGYLLKAPLVKRVLRRLVLASGGLFLATLLLSLTVVFWPRDRDVVYVEDSMRGGLVLAAEALRTGASLEQVERSYGYPLRVEEQAPAGTAERIEERGIAWFGEDELVVPMADGGFLVAGPYPDWPDPPAHELLVTLALCLLLFALGMWLALRPTARALRELETAAERIEKGQLSARSPEHPDIETTARAFNAMAETNERTLARQSELLHAVSHELRTPLARLEYAIAALASSSEGAERSQAEREAQEEIDELDALVGELLAWSRAGAELELESVELGTLAGLKGLEVQGSGSVRADRRVLQRVLDNLVANARKHGAAPIRVQFGANWIAVEDAGRGIPPEERARVLEPFVRLGSTAEGHGLGLALVQRAIQAHGGELVLGSSDLGGLRVEARFPAT